MKILKQYIPTGARHKLLFTSHHAEGMNFVDIGALLARAIESSLSNRHLSFVAEEELEKIKVGDWIFYADESVEDKGLSTSAQIVNINISDDGTYTFILNTEYQDGKTEDQGTISGNAYVYVPY